MSNLELVSGQIIYSLMNNGISGQNLIAIFDNDLELSRYFSLPDSAIIEYLIARDRFSALNWVQFQEMIGQSGRERLNAIQQESNGECLDFNDTKKLVQEVMIPAWQRNETRKIHLEALAKLDNADIPETNNSTIAQLGMVSNRLRSQSIMTGDDAYDRFCDHVDGMTGLKDTYTLITGFPKFDNIFQGFKRGKKAIVCGAPGSGKTALVSQMSAHVAMNGGVVVRFIEMSIEEEMYRDAVRESGVTGASLWAHNQRLRAMRHDPDFVEEMAEKEKYIIRTHEDVVKIKRKGFEIKQRKIRYHRAGGVTPAKALAVLNAVKAEFGKVDLVIFDHVQLAHTGKREQDSNVVRAVYQGFNEIVQPYFPQTAFVFLQHQNKSIERTVKIGNIDMVVPSQDDLAYGGHQDVDEVFFIVRPRQYKRVLGIKEEKIKEWEQAWLATKHYEDKRKRDYRFIDFLYGGYLWNLKARNAESEQAIKMRYYGERFEWKEHDFNGMGE